MRIPLSRAAAGVFLAMLVAWLVLPIAAASAATASNVQNAEEAWFLENKEPLAGLPGGDPGCDQATGCNLSGSAVRPNPHPEGVLVVAANAGAPDAQTYFTFDTQDLGLGVVVTGGTVTLPVARDADARNVNAANADMVACLTTGFVPSGTDGGSYADRPTFDKNTCVPVKLTKDDPQAEVFSVDLTRFGKAWAAGTTNNGITLMVNPEITPPAPDETWRVVFNSARRAQQQTVEQQKQPEEARIEFPAITSKLQYTEPKIACFFNCGGSGGGGETGGGLGDTSGGDLSTDTGSTDTGSTGSFGSSGTPATGTGSVTPTTDTGTTPVTPPVAAGGAPVAPGGTVATAANPPGISPAVWVTPLLAIAAAAAMAWSLMQPVELAGQREGAVSRLMRSRRLKAATPTNP